VKIQGTGGEGHLELMAPNDLSQLAGYGEAHFWLIRQRLARSGLPLKGRNEKVSPHGPILSKRSHGSAAEAEKMRRIVLILAIFLLVLVNVRSVAAGPQKRGTATVTGVVLGPDDKPVPRAAVSYQSSGGNAPHAVHADAHGHFTITKLRADNYDMRASARGVFSEWEKNITVHSGQTKSVTLRLIYAKEIPKAYVKSKPHQ